MASSRACSSFLGTTYSSSGRILSMLAPRSFLKYKSKNFASIARHWNGQRDILCFSKLPSCNFMGAQSAIGIFVCPRLNHKKLTNQWSEGRVSNALELLSKIELRSFSSNISIANAEASSDMTQGDDHPQSSSKGRKARAPSPLESLPLGYTPGQALRVLQQKGAGGKFIRRTELRDLCRAARPGVSRDANVIKTALKDFKRCNKHVLLAWEAKEAIEGMIRAMTPEILEESTVEGRLSKLVGASYVANALLDPTTGLNTSVATEDVDYILSLFLDSVEGCDLSSLRSGGGSPAEAMHLTKKIFGMLLLRASNPERYMKKRAAKKYRRISTQSDPPSPSTAHIACKICLAVGSANDAQVAVLDEFQFGCRWSAKEETIRMVNDAKRMENAVTRTRTTVAEDVLGSM